MINSNNLQQKKKKSSKDKEVAIIELGSNCSCLVYYDNGLIKKSKAFYYPQHPTNAVKKSIDRRINAEYKLWLKCLWHYGYLEEDDIQLLEYKRLDKKNTK